MLVEQTGYWEIYPLSVEFSASGRGSVSLWVRIPGFLVKKATGSLGEAFML